MLVPAVVVEKLEKSFAGKRFLEEIDLSVQAGEYIGLIGANGAGKTTLIKCLLDFCAIDSGSITLFGIPHTEVRARQSLAFLPERFTPPHYLTGRDFLCYMSALRGIKYSESRVAELLEVMDMDLSALAKSVRLYSKGMAQKLGLVACLCSDKQLFIFDEPMSGLDPKARAWFKEYLLKLKKIGKTLFFSTHLLADVEVLCDRIIILDGGKIKFIGTVEQCCQTFCLEDIESAYMACIAS